MSIYKYSYKSFTRAMGALLSRSSDTDILSVLTKDGLKVKLPAFRIEPSDRAAGAMEGDWSFYTIVQQWLALMLVTGISYLLFVNRNAIMEYVRNFDSEQFTEDFASYRSGAIDKLSSASSFVKTNIVDEIASAAKSEVTSIAKDTFRFVKAELVGPPVPSEEEQTQP